MANNFERELDVVIIYNKYSAIISHTHIHTSFSGNIVSASILFSEEMKNLT